MENKNRRVVITGMGVVSSVGNNVETYWKNLVDGVCGIEFVEEFKDVPVKFAGKVKDFNPEEYGMDKPFIRKQDSFTLYAMAAAWQAMQQCGLKTEGDDANIDPYRLGVYVGSGIGGFEVQYRETQKMLEDPTGQWISPLFIATMISNIAAGQPVIQVMVTPIVPGHRVVNIEIIHIHTVFALRRFQEKRVHGAQTNIHFACPEFFPVALKKIQGLFIV